MNIAKLYGDDAWDFLGNVIEPAGVIFGDEKVRDMLTGANGAKKNAFGAAARICREHKGEAREILAALAGIPPEKYRPNPFQIIAEMVNFLNQAGSADITAVFSLPEQIEGEKLSGDASGDLGEET